MADSDNLKPPRTIDGSSLVATCLSRAGVTHMFGVVGIPVTSLATRAVALGIRFIAFHNEQSAGYAASAYGFLTGKPGVLLTVSGPGCVHALAGLSNAAVNHWPLLLISGSSDQSLVGRGDFQELDQMEVVKPFSKFSAKASDITKVPSAVFEALDRAVKGRPGGCYLDVPTDVLHQCLGEVEAEKLIADVAYRMKLSKSADVATGVAGVEEGGGVETEKLVDDVADGMKLGGKDDVVEGIADVADEVADVANRLILGKSDGVAAGVADMEDGGKLGESDDVADGVGDVEKAAELLRRAERPLIVFGKGAAYARAENELRKLVETTGIPFLPTPMGKGILPDNHDLAASAARSLAIGKCDVALVVGARLNWLLHFGEAPKWSKDVKFILVDVSEEEIELRKPCVGLVGDAKKIVGMLSKEIKDRPFCFARNHPWVESIARKAKENVLKMEAQLQKDVVPFNFMTPMRIIRDAILNLGSPAPVLVSEGANTMDVGRAVLVQMEPRTRLDAGTWGTMGVGLGYCIAAAIASPERLVVAVEGDSGFGFSAMEVETLVRYQLPVVVIVFNNGGVYGGDRRSPEEISGPYKDDPAPTSFVPGAAYHLVMEAFGGKGYLVGTPDELRSALSESFSAKKPAVINVTIDPYAGAESGRMQHKN